MVQNSKSNEPIHSRRTLFHLPARYSGLGGQCSDGKRSKAKCHRHTRGRPRLWRKNRTVNGTFASLAPARNSPTVGFGFLFTLWHGLTRRVNGRKREERAGSCGEFCHQRKPLPHRLQCGSVIKRREGMAPALSGDECRAWAGHPVMIARTLHHPGTAPAHPSRQAAPALVTRAVDPAVRQDASGFSESAPGR